MKQFARILSFELKNYFTNKVFVGITLFLVVAIAAVMSFPRLSGLFAGDGEPGGSRAVMLLCVSSEQSGELVHEYFAAAFTEHEVRLTGEDREQIQERVRSGEADCAFVLEDITRYTYYVDDLSIADTNPAVATGVLQELYRLCALMGTGMSAEQAGQIMQVAVQGSVESLGRDQTQNFLYTYVMIMALYMVILLYGQMVTTSVATEKSSRAMELLITSARPTSMMFGKVLASCLAGLTQLALIFGTAVLFFEINKSYWGENRLILSLFAIPPELLGYMLVFFVLGFLIYAFLFGAIGSTATKLEDINTSTMPLMFLFIFAFLAVMLSMSSGAVDGLLMRICSFVPFTSPMAMFTRIAMSSVPAYEILISIAILVLTTVGVGVLSAKIYRAGVLMYGTPPKLGTILRAIKKA